MRVEKFVAKKNKKLSLLIQENLGLSYNLIQKIIRSKDVKINNSRVSKDASVIVGDEVCVYLPDQVNRVEILYEDDDIIVVFKKRQLETISLDSKNDLLTAVNNLLNKKCFAVHRLDRNTEGLVVFAKNEQAKQCLDMSFRERTIEKLYLAKVYGFVANGVYNAYLKKDSKLSLVYISDTNQPNYEKITTKVKVLSSSDDTSIVEIELVTGKTHQIRAHLAHLGAFVLGDEKYGDPTINKKFKKRFQCLCAYKIKFKFKKDDYLSKLNGLVISLDKSKIDFCNDL